MVNVAPNIWLGVKISANLSFSSVVFASDFGTWYVENVDPGAGGRLFIWNPSCVNDILLARAMMCRATCGGRFRACWLARFWLVPQSSHSWQLLIAVCWRAGTLERKHGNKWCR